MVETLILLFLVTIGCMFLSYKIYSKSKIISEKLKTAEEKLEKYKPIEDIEMYIKKFRKEASNVENEHDQRKQFLKNEIKELKLTLEDYEYQFFQYLQER